MSELIQRLFRSGPRRARAGGRSYRSVSCAPLRPWQVRERRFGVTRLGRRGLDPDEVWEFLDRVAGDLACVYDALAASREETMRVKNALREWQSRQARMANSAGGRY